MSTRCNLFIRQDGIQQSLTKKPDGFPEHVRNHVQNWLDMGSPGLLVDYLTEGPYKRHGFGDWPSYYIHVVVADPPHTVAMYSSCGGSWTLTARNREAEWQEAIEEADTAVQDALQDAANDAFDLDKRVKAVSAGIQALEELARRHSDIVAGD